jgi:hypothetical protein
MLDGPGANAKHFYERNKPATHKRHSIFSIILLKKRTPKRTGWNVPGEKARRAQDDTGKAQTAPRCILSHAICGSASALGAC